MARGGARKGSGRKPNYPNEGKTVSIRVPESSIEAVKAAILEQKLFIEREKVEQLSTTINVLLLAWERKTDRERWERLRDVSRELGKWLE